MNLYESVPPRPDPERVVRDYFQRLLVDRDLSVCEELLADDCLDHDAPGGASRGPGPTRAYVSQMLNDYPDLRFTIEAIVSHDRSVALRVRWSGAPPRDR